MKTGGIAVEYATPLQPEGCVQLCEKLLWPVAGLVAIWWRGGRSQYKLPPMRQSRASQLLCPASSAAGTSNRQCFLTYFRKLHEKLTILVASCKRGSSGMLP